MPVSTARPFYSSTEKDQESQDSKYQIPVSAYKTSPVTFLRKGNVMTNES